MTEHLSGRWAVVRAFVFAAALVVALVAAAAVPRPADAANGLEPILDCVTYDGANNLLTAHWGYSNINGVQIIPAQSDNYFDPPPFFRGQPTTFEPGTYRDVFQTTFDADEQLTWTLFGSSVTASNDPSLYCDGGPDTVPPDTAIVDGPRGTVGDAAATFDFFSEGGARFECSLDAADFAACDAPHVLAGLSGGPHTFQVRARDAAGNVDATPASRTWTVDKTAPDPPTVTSPTGDYRDRDGSFNVRGTAEPGSTVRLYEDGTRVGTSETDPETGAWGIAVVDVPEGPHVYKARATDPVGNVSVDSAETTVTVDTTAPRVTTRTPTGAVEARNALVTATFSESMDAASVEAPGTVRLGLLDSRGRTTPVAAGVSYDPDTKKVTLDPAARLVRGATYSATVRTVAKDEAGNALVRAKTWRFTVTER